METIESKKLQQARRAYDRWSRLVEYAEQNSDPYYRHKEIAWRLLRVKAAERLARSLLFSEQQKQKVEFYEACARAAP